jgi:hypothetical protein
MSAMQRHKGAAGKGESAALIGDRAGWDARRRVRQHDGDSDLLGVPGWTIEMKRHARQLRTDIAAWWRQGAASTRAMAFHIFQPLPSFHNGWL